MFPKNSFHSDRFSGAGIDTGLAIDAHILVDFCLVIFHGDCRSRAFTHAGLTSGTLSVVNDCYQLVHSTLYVGERRKKGFR
ncbi:MAG: hypothetical protein METHP_00083 [Methanoregula sp. SKADARSKE-2]|nr:MAG: hypothetical protein METHP_00083 [Methanoregula sp. SKADARSKE-2]